MPDIFNRASILGFSDGSPLTNCGDDDWYAFRLRPHPQYFLTLSVNWYLKFYNSVSTHLDRSFACRKTFLKIYSFSFRWIDFRGGFHQFIVWITLRSWNVPEDGQKTLKTIGIWQKLIAWILWVRIVTVVLLIHTTWMFEGVIFWRLSITTCYK